LWVKHPLIWGQIVVFATNDHSEVTELLFVLAFNKSMGSWDFLVSHLVESKAGNGHKGGSRIESNKTTTWSVVTNIERVSVNFNIIKPNSEHILEGDVIPMDIPLEFCLIEIPESQIRLDAVLFLILNRRQIE